MHIWKKKNVYPKIFSKYPPIGWNCSQFSKCVDLCKQYSSVCSIHAFWMFDEIFLVLFFTLSTKNKIGSRLVLKLCFTWFLQRKTLNTNNFSVNFTLLLPQNQCSCILLFHVTTFGFRWQSPVSTWAATDSVWRSGTTPSAWCTITAKRLGRDIAWWSTTSNLSWGRELHWPKYSTSSIFRGMRRCSTTTRWSTNPEGSPYRCKYISTAFMLFFIVFIVSIHNSGVLAERQPYSSFNINKRKYLCSFILVFRPRFNLT